MVPYLYVKYSMRNFIKLVENMSVPSVLYHGTKASNHEFIEQNGLIKEMDQSWREFGEGIYLTNSAETARQYGEVVYTIDVTQLNTRLMVPDDYELKDYFDGVWGDGTEGDYEDHEERPSGIYEATWLDSLRICSQCQYLGNIPPSALAIVPN